MKKLVVLLNLLFVFSLAFSQNGCNNYWSAISPDGNYIYFSSDRDGEKYEIYRVDIDGVSNLIRLTTDSNFDKLYPSINHDGSLIAFQYGDYGATTEVYIMNNDGTNLTQLTDNSVYDGYPNFSPDGTKIVFDAWDDTTYPEIFTMNIDGTERTQLTNETGAYWQSAPIYNPSGTYLYVSMGYNADNYFARMNLDGTNLVNITQPNTFGFSEWALHFNADASKITFYTTEWVGYYNGSDIVIADTTGENWNQLTNSSNGSYYSFPFFHPSNNKIYYSYYSSNANDYWSIYTMDLDGSNPQELITCGTVGLSENYDLSKNLIYPNPCHNQINIDFMGEVNIEIHDLTGRLVLSSTFKNIDVSQLESGIYAVIIKDVNDKIIKTEKLIKSE